VTKIETLTLEAGERGEIVLYPERDTRGPSVVVEGSGDSFVVEDVLLGNLPAPSVEVSDTPRGTWAARVGDVLAGPEKPVKVLVRNTGADKITLRASLDAEKLTMQASLDAEEQ
jgi:hypothetical protein